ncbi:integrin alpha-6 [Echinops telfairi]|uniref:Integrin alpha-6 n=1 Tax=Echinops telfairi TaxID=9371 RepID=A0AC55DQ49_ECHTE|nr:integrin alpha-6 [Echinops telfairi]
MGVTVQSQGPGGKVVTCAHRYEKRQHVNTKQETRDIFGRCYVLSQNLRIEDDMDGGDWSFCDGRLRGHEKFGSCQQGVAATFTKDFHYIVFGAPGTYNWKGIVRVEQKNNTFFDMNIFEDGPYEVGGETNHDESLVPVPANSYLGFSLDSGKGIMSKDELTFVSGAPRANHSGAVVLLKRDMKSTHLLPEHIFDGEGLASSFGYDVAVVDLNKDGWQDIVIGAPQYFDRDGEVGGAVYVYINQQGRWKNVKPIRLNGTKDSMFGIAVTNIGDINQDGYPDIAVGAPYDDMGKVFIYHGSPNGINTKPTQVLEGKTPYFGYSIAGNMDLDRNSYPDLAVGSLSDSVTVFRCVVFDSTSPGSINEVALKIFMFWIGKYFNVSGESVHLQEVEKICLKGLSNTGTLEVYTHLFSFLWSFYLVIVGTLEAEKERRKSGLSSRVQFRGQASEPKYTRVLTLNRQKQKVCMEEQLWLQENIRDKLRPIPLSASVEIQESGSRRRVNSLPEVLPILNANEPKTIHRDVHFLKEGCGNDNICNSNLKLEYKFCTREGNQDKLGSLIEYEFRVINLGKPLKNLGTATLNIEWPKEVSNSKWLLYLVKVESKGLEMITCDPPGEVNPLNLKESHHSRKKRETAEKQIDDSRKFSLFSERKYKTLDCSVNVRCVPIRCPLRGLDSKASVVLRSRLWNGTFLEEYSKLNYLDIMVRASINVTAAAENIKLPNAGTQVRGRGDPSARSAQYSGVPWWIILVAILAGILMLALLVLVLWKCGFFRRARYEDSVPEYSAIRIPKEEREITDEKYSNDTLEKKPWITKWNENESYS